MLVPYEMDGRMVVRGVLGCPICQREFRITHGVAVFELSGRTGEPAPVSASDGRRRRHRRLSRAGRAGRLPRTLRRGIRVRLRPGDRATRRAPRGTQSSGRMDRLSPG